MGASLLALAKSIYQTVNYLKRTRFNLRKSRNQYLTNFKTKRENYKSYSITVIGKRILTHTCALIPPPLPLQHIPFRSLKLPMIFTRETLWLRPVHSLCLQVNLSASKGFYPNVKLGRFLCQNMFSLQNRTNRTLSVNYPLDCASQYLIPGNLYCKLYFLFPIRKDPRRLINSFNISPYE